MKWTTLEDVSTLVSKGTTPTTLGHSFVPDGIPFLRAEDVIGTAINPKTVGFCISEETDKLLSRSQLQPGDLLITIAGTLGRIGYVPMNAPPLNCNQAVAFVRLKPQVIDLLYACFACRAQVVDLLTLRKIGTIGNLNLEQVRQFKIPLPPLCEQKRIATLLRRAERLCRTRGYALELTDTFLPAAFLEFFGDVQRGTNHRVTLQEVADILTGYPFPSEEYVTSGDTIRLCRGANILPGRLDWSDLAAWSRSNIASFFDFILQPGDVLVAMDRPWILQGFKVTQVHHEDCPSLLVQRVARLRGRNGIPNSYLYYLLRQQSFTHHCRPTETTIPHISPTDIQTFSFNLAPLPLQQKFAALVERVERLRAVQREALRQAEHLFASLLQRAFSD